MPGLKQQELYVPHSYHLASQSGISGAVPPFLHMTVLLRKDLTVTNLHEFIDKVLAY